MLNKFYSHAMPALINWSDPRDYQGSSSTNFHAEQFQIYGLMYISLIGRLPLADSTPRWEEDCAPGARIIAPKPLRGQTHLGCSLAPKVFKVSDWDSGGHVMTRLLGLLNPRQADNCNDLLIGQTHVGLSLVRFPDPLVSWGTWLSYVLLRTTTPSGVCLPSPSIWLEI